MLLIVVGSPALSVPCCLGRKIGSIFKVYPGFVFLSQRFLVLLNFRTQPKLDRNKWGNSGET